VPQTDERGRFCEPLFFSAPYRSGLSLRQNTPTYSDNFVPAVKTVEIGPHVALYKDFIGGFFDDTMGERPFFTCDQYDIANYDIAAIGGEVINVAGNGARRHRGAVHGDGQPTPALHQLPGEVGGNSVKVFIHYVRRLSYYRKYYYTLLRRRSFLASYSK
jgi:hypothetical protein